MQLGQTEKYSLPEVAPPFVTVARIANQEGLPDRNRPHFHSDTIELCAILRGQLDWFVADEVFVVRPGEVIAIPQNTVHGAVDAYLQPCELITVHFAPELLPPALDSGLRDMTARRMRSQPICDRVLDVWECVRGDTPFRKERMAAFGTLLASEVISFDPGDAEREESRLVRLAQRALMGKGAARPTVDEVARRLGVSAVWLNKLFVRETGASPGDWARAKRISEAKRRLAEGVDSTVAIALDLGYSSSQYFATAFRKESGMTPSEYRTLHSGGCVERRVYRVDMRETWIEGVRIYPPKDDGLLPPEPDPDSY